LNCLFAELAVASHRSNFLEKNSVLEIKLYSIFDTELHANSPTVRQSPKFLVASICDLPDVINCQFHEFEPALSGPVHFLSPDQQSGIHCLIICAIQLLTPNNIGGNLRRICSLDI